MVCTSCTDFIEIKAAKAIRHELDKTLNAIADKKDCGENITEELMSFVDVVRGILEMSDTCEEDISKFMNEWVE